MKTIIKITMFFIVSMIVLNTTGQVKFKGAKIQHAIKVCKKETPRKIQKKLNSSYPRELIEDIGDKIKDVVKKDIEEALDSYKKHGMKNAENMKNHQFKIKTKNAEIDEKLKNYLLNYQEYLLEEDSLVKSSIVTEITNDIISTYYIPNLQEGIKRYIRSWLLNEEEKYILFLKTETIHQRINSNDHIKLISKSYLEDKYDDINFMIKIIDQGFDSKSINLDFEFKSKYSFEYLDKLILYLEKKGKNKILKEINQKIQVDIKNLIEVSTEIK